MLRRKKSATRRWNLAPNTGLALRRRGFLDRRNFGLLGNWSGAGLLFPKCAVLGKLARLARNAAVPLPETSPGNQSAGAKKSLPTNALRRRGCCFPARLAHFLWRRPIGAKIGVELRDWWPSLPRRTSSCRSLGCGWRGIPRTPKLLRLACPERRCRRGWKKWVEKERGIGGSAWPSEGTTGRSLGRLELVCRPVDTADSARFPLR